MTNTLTTAEITYGLQRAYAIVPNIPGLSTMNAQTLIANIHATSAVNPPQLDSLDSQGIGAMLLQLYHDTQSPTGNGAVTQADLTGFSNLMIAANNAHPFQEPGTNAQLFAELNTQTTAPFLGRITPARLEPFAAEALKIFANANGN